VKSVGMGKDGGLTCVFDSDEGVYHDDQLEIHWVVYYESRKRELKRRLINEGRCDERLKAKVEESTCLTYTGFHDKTN
jgi:hypothetical protein